jgi:pimeloyl-ACP methyl ester carboxylesterase
MPYVTAADGAQIFFTDRGEGRPVVLSHGWPLNSDSWEAQQLVPFEVGGTDSAERIKNARLVVCPGAPHGLPDTPEQQLSDDLLAFLRSPA